ncbi:MAG: hypothetical protein AB7G15_11020, partial [Alphaproteobacteria bacterium]
IVEARQIRRIEAILAGKRTGADGEQDARRRRYPFEPPQAHGLLRLCSRSRQLRGWTVIEDSASRAK